MRLWPPIAASILAASFSAPRAAASTFDAGRGAVQFDAPALLTVGFEDAESLRKLAPARFAVDVSRGYATFTSVAAPLDAQSFQGPGIEGAHALRIGARQAVRLGDPATLNALGGGRVELSFFAKADGARPELLVVYDNRALEAEGSEYLLVRDEQKQMHGALTWTHYAARLDAAVPGVAYFALVVPNGKELALAGPELLGHAAPEKRIQRVAPRPASRAILAQLEAAERLKADHLIRAMPRPRHPAPTAALPFTGGQ
jgi:hypothetical protein